MDYTELLVEVRERTGLANVIDRGSRIVANAERYLEKRLKTREMETTVTLATDEDGLATLPVDFLQLITNEWAIIGGNTVLTATQDGSVDISYYAKLPSTEAFDTNWLLTAEDELYVQAVMMQAYLVNAMPAEALATKEVVDALIADVMRADFAAKYMNRGIDNGGAW